MTRRRDRLARLASEAPLWLLVLIVIGAIIFAVVYFGWIYEPGGFT